jgi:hypothetical protein
LGVQVHYKEEGNLTIVHAKLWTFLLVSPPQSVLQGIYFHVTYKLNSLTETSAFAMVTTLLGLARNVRDMISSATAHPDDPTPDSHGLAGFIAHMIKEKLECVKSSCCYCCVRPSVHSSSPGVKMTSRRT